MNPALRKLAQGPHGDLAGQAYLAAMNLVRSGLATKAEITARLLLKTTLARSDGEVRILLRRCKERAFPLSCVEH